MKTNDTRFIETMSNIRTALSEGDNSFVAEMLDCSNAKGFLVEMNSHDRQYYVKIRVDADLEFVMLEIHPNITIGEPYKRMFNQFAMMKSREKKVGNIRIGAGNAAEIYLETSFSNGPVTADAYERMERIAMQFTISVEDELDMIAHGIIPEDNKSKENDVKEAVEHLMNRMKDKHEEEKPDSDDGESAPTPTPFADFLSFLSSHSSGQSDDDDDDSIIDVDSDDCDIA